MEEVIRAMNYKLFSLLFLYPKEEKFRKALDIIDDLSSFTDIYSKLKGLLDNHIKGRMKDLRVEYTSLFINNFPSVPCAPYESFFRFNRLSDPNIISSLIRYYDQLGFGAGLEANDHISTELEFMFVVITSDGLSEDRRFSLQKAFFSKHLSLWVLDFANCVKENTKVEFYSVLADLFKEFIEKEFNYLGV